MNNYTFKDRNGTIYKRITKAQAKKAYENGFTLFLCPCNLLPFSMFHNEIDINKNDYIKHGYKEPFKYDDGTTDYDFKRRVNYFEYYNCINTETGLYTAFYVAID